MMCVCFGFLGSSDRVRRHRCGALGGISPGPFARGSVVRRDQGESSQVTRAARRSACFRGRQT
eukprot:scaffold26432_cov33-Tisochrysis_lutea.AAC.1